MDLWTDPFEVSSMLGGPHQWFHIEQRNLTVHHPTPPPPPLVVIDCNILCCDFVQASAAHFIKSAIKLFFSQLVLIDVKFYRDYYCIL